MNKIAKRPIIIDGDKIQKPTRISLSNGTFQEDWMQALLAAEPSILPTADIDPIFAPLICIGREVRTNAGPIDNMYISPNGYLVIVETKLWRNPEARREVVGQILDYAREVRTWDYEKIDDIFKTNNKKSIFEAMVERGYKSVDDQAAFIDITTKNIQSARFLLMIVGDGIREGVEKLIEYMNISPDMQHRIALCELEVYDMGAGKRLVVPQLTTKTTIVERSVIRIENNIATIVQSDDEENTKIECKSYKRNTDTISRDDFINQFVSNNPNISKDDLFNFLDDVESLGFEVYFNARNCGIRLKNNATILELDQKAVSFYPSRIKAVIERRGYSAAIAEKYADDMRQFLSTDAKSKTYNNQQGYYNLDNKILNDRKDDLLSVLEQLKNNF